MRIKTEPNEIWREYERCVSYNNSIELYETVERNENFYNDKQWEGVKAPNIDKPVFNFLKPVVNYYVAQLASDDIGMSIEYAGGFNADDELVPKLISQEIDNVIERCNLKFLNRKIIRNNAVDGDACLYLYFDPDIKNGKETPGEICAEIVDNTNVMFGNPSDDRVESQPYILIAYRRLVDEVKEEAKAEGINPETIIPDGGMEYVMNADKDSDNLYCTAIVKFWKESANGEKTVRFCKVTQTATIKPPTDTGYRLYPISYTSWETVKNSYHGVSPITGKIQNQIFVNKLYAMAMEYTKKMAFPKILYDRTKIPDGWNNNIGQAVGVAGNPQDAFFASFAPNGMSNNVSEMIQSTITQSKEMMGAYDAALGNVNPNNTSAIIATQKAAAAPLDIQKLDLYNFIESYIRIIIDMMRVNYGVRTVSVDTPDGGKEAVPYDFGGIDTYALNLNIEIGPASYWSETMQISTLDNLMNLKIIPSARLYLEAIPDGYIKNKDKIIDALRQMEDAQMGVTAEQTQQAQPQGELSDDDIMQMSQELAGLDAEAQAQAISAAQISDADKDRLAAAIAAMKEGDTNVM